MPGADAPPPATGEQPYEAPSAAQAILYDQKSNLAIADYVLLAIGSPEYAAISDVAVVAPPEAGSPYAVFLDVAHGWGAPAP